MLPPLNSGSSSPVLEKSTLVQLYYNLVIPRNQTTNVQHYLLFPKFISLQSYALLVCINVSTAIFWLLVTMGV